MALITGWKCRWPNITAPSMMSSDSSFASDSTISTASCVPATTRSSWLSAISSIVGLSTYSPLDEADARAADRAHEGRAGQRERGGSGDHGDDVGIVLLVVRERGDDHLRVAAPAVGEERTDRAVDQARGQRVLFGRTAFALEEAAGNAARGVIFFLVIDGERQEIDAGLRLLRRDHGREHGGFAVGGNDGAVGLARDFSGLEGELAPAPVEFNAIDIEHLFRLSWFSDKGLKAMSKTARGCSRMRASTASGDPAMAFHPFRMRTGNHAPVPFSAALAAARIAARYASAHNRAGSSRADLNGGY